MSIVSSTHRKGYSISIEQELIEMTSMGHSYISKDWRYVDKEGHPHGPELLLAEWVVLGTYWCDTCRDEHEDSELRCTLCGEKIEPKYGWTGPDTHRLPGLQTATLKADDGRVYTLRLEDLARWMTEDDMDSFATEVMASRVPDYIEGFTT